MKPRCVLLLSGGLDSTTVLAMARAEGFDCHALSFAYGQRHRVELAAAARVAQALGAADHRVAQLDLGWIGGSALTADLPVPKDALENNPTIPVTYVPARNALFLCHALAWAEVLGAQDLFAGMNVLDYSGYPDCRPEFIGAFAEMARLGTRAGVQGRPFRIRTPLMHLNKAEIIRAGALLGVDYALTHSCYDPVEGAGPGGPGGPQGQDHGVRACGHCDACLLRKRGFVQAGLPDPTHYI